MTKIRQIEGSKVEDVARYILEHLKKYFTVTHLYNNIFFWKSNQTVNPERVFYHRCSPEALGEITNKKSIAYCTLCAKSLNTPYKHIIFSIKLSAFNK